MARSKNVLVAVLRASKSKRRHYLLVDKSGKIKEVALIPLGSVKRRKRTKKKTKRRKRKR